MSRTSRVILVVDDNPDDADLTVRAFRHSSPENTVVVLHDGPTALRYLLGSEGEEPKDAPALVLLDLKLGGMGGLEVLRLLRAQPRGRQVPVVILSSSTEPSDIARSYELGANSYLRKPVDSVEFNANVDLLRRYWLGLNQSAPDQGGGA
jgi:two-component system, response regulator